MKCNIKRKRAEEKVDSAYKTIGKTILAFLDASAGCVICDFCGYKAKRLREMYNGTQQVLGSMMEFYGAENDDDRERADMSLFVAKRRLAECGFDFASATESLPASDTFGLTWHPDSEWQKHAQRAKLIQDMELVVQTYHATLLLWFRQKCGYGKSRLSALYGLLRTDYNLLVTEYLRCCLAGDTQIRDMLTARQDRMEKVGLEFVEV